MCGPRVDSSGSEWEQEAEPVEHGNELSISHYAENSKCRRTFNVHECFCSPDVQYLGVMDCGFWGSSFILSAHIILDILQCRTHLTFKGLCIVIYSYN